jgi:plasmid stabilization system protein ParE
MADEDEEARKAQAARLRAQIERLVAGQPPAGSPDQPSPESPRAYIERRMREIDEDQQEDP